MKLAHQRCPDAANRDVRPGFHQIKTVAHLDTDSPPDDVEAMVGFVQTHCLVEDTVAVGTTLNPPTVLVNG